MVCQKRENYPHWRVWILLLQYWKSMWACCRFLHCLFLTSFFCIFKKGTVFSVGKVNRNLFGKLGIRILFTTYSLLGSGSAVRKASIKADPKTLELTNLFKTSPLVEMGEGTWYAARRAWRAARCQRDSPHTSRRLEGESFLLTPVPRLNSLLKRLSHEIDVKNFD